MDVTPRVHVLSLGFCAASAFLALPYSSAVVIMCDFHVTKVTTPPCGTSPSNIYCRPKYKSQTDDGTGWVGGILTPRLTSVTTLPLLLWIPRTETPPIRSHRLSLKRRHSPTSGALVTVLEGGFHLD